MDERNNDLWQGGPWERSDPRGSMPGAMPPRYVPPRPVLRPRRRKRRFSLPVCMGLAALLVSLVAIGAVMDSLWPVQLLPGGDEDYAYRQPGRDEEKLDTTPPAIPRAETGTGVTVELCPDSGESLTYTQIYDKNLPSMVSIQAEDAKSYSTGTGVVLTADGYLITNAHVVAGADKVQVACADNRVLDAALVGFDAREDLAVLKVEADDLTPAEFGDSFALRCGDPVAAIGDPLGYRSTITDGIVSALDRDVEVDGTSMVLIQTSAAINMGNSGGALINQYGQVVGITTVKIVTDDGSAESLGFAIPSRRVKYVADTLIAGKQVRRGIFGFTVLTRTAQGGGLTLDSVDKTSDAYAKGLRAGDVLTAADGQSLNAVEDLVRLKQSMGAGDTVSLTYVRSGQSRTVSVTLIDPDEQT
ncbi:S1C family serine protease [Flintibacter faecis]|uniref:Trypsin-like peptidase domain-containing protein n=1 Tax=Flintibacter faecis TaxID=2763047 RepID=A0A8J6M483_9FIRM|nr:trypsin-like peptidase domain-containing protein [Flintibacter faecis]MBC5716237.1 trypsin-like peptidase domain-containing protein [Flintibacter faecis]